MFEAAAGARTAPFCHRPPVESISALTCAGAMPKRVPKPNMRASYVARLAAVATSSSLPMPGAPIFVSTSSGSVSATRRSVALQPTASRPFFTSSARVRTWPYML